MPLDLAAHPLRRRLGPDPAVEVVGHGRDDGDDDDAGERPVDHERQERQPEHVEAHVLAELRVDDAEVLGVGEEDPALPLPRHPGPGDDGEEGGHDEAHERGAPADQLPVALDDLLLRAGGPEGGRQAVGDEQVDVEQDEEDGGEDRPEGDAGAQHAGEDARVVERVEPEVVGVEAGDPTQRREEHEEGDGEDDEPDAPS